MLLGSPLEFKRSGNSRNQLLLPIKRQIETILLIWLQNDDLKGNMNHTGAVRVFKSPVIRKQDLNYKQPFEILEKIEKKLFRFDIIEV